MSVVAQILRTGSPSTWDTIAGFMPGYQPDTTYPEELEGGYYTFSDPDDLRDFFRSSQFRTARSEGGKITMLQLSGTSVWIRYPIGSTFYRRRVRAAIATKNNSKRKKVFFVRLGKLMLQSITIPK